MSFSNVSFVRGLDGGQCCFSLILAHSGLVPDGVGVVVTSGVDTDEDVEADADRENDVDDPSPIPSSRSCDS